MCGDFTALTADPKQADADRQWFTARHRPTETSCAAAEERAAGRKRS
jgi:hypothetical protein